MEIAACSQNLQNVNEEILCVPFSEKDIAREAKCFFDTKNKHWTIKNDNPNFDEIVKKYKPIALNNSTYDQRDQIKALGARWDSKNKKWIIPNYRRELFKQWL